MKWVRFIGLGKDVGKGLSWVRESGFSKRIRFGYNSSTLTSQDELDVWERVSVDARRNMERRERWKPQLESVIPSH
jgi:hypothetical protein